MKLLDGIKVLDMSRLIPGPYVAMLLGDMGADVIKLEEQSVGDYLVSHTPTTFLMGPDGEFVALYPHGTKPEFMAASIRRHISE